MFGEGNEGRETEGKGKGKRRDVWMKQRDGGISTGGRNLSGREEFIWKREGGERE